MSINLMPVPTQLKDVVSINLTLHTKTQTRRPRYCDYPSASLMYHVSLYVLIHEPHIIRAIAKGTSYSL